MNTNNNYNKNLQPFASKLRRNMTKAEACLWKYALRASCMGVPFRRERPIGRFIADFVCLPLKLVIEVDGVTHLYEETQIKDVQKDKELKEMGFEVLRLGDDVILNNIGFVTGVIRDKIEELRKIHPLPPPAGENSHLTHNSQLITHSS
jgi:very-short-patch-repair endonuclease